jgi:hypothetical protein
MRIEDRGHGYGMRTGAAVCSVCGFKIGNISKHVAWHKGQGGTVPNLVDAITAPVVAASAKARQAALRAQARRLLKPSKAHRTAELHQKARAVLGADDWRVYFEGRRALTQKRNALSELGFRLTGDSDAFRR